MSDDKDGNKLEWHNVDAHHLRAPTDAGFDYDIIFTPDCQVSWQGLDFGEWKYEADLDDAKAAAQAEFDGIKATSVSKP